MIRARRDILQAGGYLVLVYQITEVRQLVVAKYIVLWTWIR